MYSVKQEAEDPNVDNKLNTADLETVKEKTKEVMALCERNYLQADKEEYEEKQNNLSSTSVFSYHGQAPWTAAATAASLQLFRRTHRGRNGLSRSNSGVISKDFYKAKRSVNYSTPQKDQSITASFLLTFKFTL